MLTKRLAFFVYFILLFFVFKIILYSLLGSPDEVNFDLPEEPELVEIIGECSTLPDGLEVKVRADGCVTTVEKKCIYFFKFFNRFSI